MIGQNSKELHLLTICDLRNARQSFVPSICTYKTFDQWINKLDLNIDIYIRDTLLMDLLNVHGEFPKFVYPIKTYESLKPDQILLSDQGLSDVYSLYVRIEAMIKKSRWENTIKAEDFPSLALHKVISQLGSRQNAEVLLLELRGSLDVFLNDIFGNEVFQNIESTLNGINDLLQAQKEHQFVISLINLSFSDLKDDLRRSSDVEDTALFFELYTHQTGQFGGIPYNFLVLDYYFSQSNGDLPMLKKIAELSQSLGLICLSSVSPVFIGIKDFQLSIEAESISDVFSSLKLLKYRNFITEASARYISLSLPRYCSRAAYKDELGFFSEQIGLLGCLSNSAYLMAKTIVVNAIVNGICTEPSGSNVQVSVNNEVLRPENLETTFSSSIESVLVKLGLNPICSLAAKRTCYFHSFNSLQWGKFSLNMAKYKVAEVMETNLIYMLIVLSFTQQVKVVCREQIGLSKGVTEVTSNINHWLSQHVTNITQPSMELLKSRPLKFAEISEVETLGDGFYAFSITIEPHFTKIKETSAIAVSMQIQRTA